MYIVQVLIEHPINALNRPFSYLSKQEVTKGVRVRVHFNRQRLVGYVLGCTYTALTSSELNKRDGFRYSYIEEVIDEKPLLNDELMNLSERMSKMLICSQIACLQAMLPRTLKPASTKAVTIKYQKAAKVIRIGEAKTKTQNELYEYLTAPGTHFIKDIPYSKSPLDALVKQGLVEIYDEEVRRNPYEGKMIEPNTVELTPKQKEVVEEIMSEEGGISLIHGVTGSGKTEVYLHLTEKMIRDHKNVIMLVPEISLTPMMVENFKKRFGEDVAIFHSRLSEGERYDEYRRIANGEVHIVVGARSAVFAPLKNIGMIILDEEHDSSYKQESNPRYSTMTIAKMRAQYHNARIILGSATPSVESYARAKQGIYKLYEMKERINKKPLPPYTIVDMGQEAKSGNHGLLSRLLENRLQETLDKGEQAILLLNKRGYASFVRCDECGEIIKCPHCDVTLTYHIRENRLKCHYCEYSIPMPDTCPTCHSPELKKIGFGTQRIEEEISSKFPRSKVIRYDYDTTRNKNDHLRLLNAFSNQKADIMLGTQMIAKGLNFPNVTFVGVINADLTLSIPDYRSSERTFQLLAQVGGRSGRGNKSGTVLIQTYNPEHYAIVDGAKADYDAFFKEEMAYRKMAMYPPYCHILSIIVQSKDQGTCKRASLDVKDYLVEHVSNVRVIGPTESAIFKLQDIYRERIIIKYKKADLLYKALNELEDYYNHQNRKVTLVYDFNPYTSI